VENIYTHFIDKWIGEGAAPVIKASSKEAGYFKRERELSNWLSVPLFQRGLKL
jgi:hypothetical protein